MQDGKNNRTSTTESSNQASGAGVEEIQENNAGKVYRCRFPNGTLIPRSEVEVMYLGEDFAWRKQKGMALWDTGSTWTTISKAVADRIGAKLTPGGGVKGIDDKKESWDTIVNLRIGRDMVIPFTEVSVIDYSDDNHPDVIIGMDIIASGRFEIDSTGDETILTFEL